MVISTFRINEMRSVSLFNSIAGKKKVGTPTFREEKEEKQSFNVVDFDTHARIYAS